MSLSVLIKNENEKNKLTFLNAIEMESMSRKFFSEMNNIQIPQFNEGANISLPLNPSNKNNLLAGIETNPINMNPSKLMHTMMFSHQAIF
jgi:hypothetical protein